MAGDKSRNLQEVFLNNVRKSHVAVTVFLVNGVKLQGVITWFDNFSILLRKTRLRKLNNLAKSAFGKRREAFDALRSKAENPKLAREHLLKTSMIEGLRRSEELL